MNPRSLGLVIIVTLHLTTAANAQTFAESSSEAARPAPAIHLSSSAATGTTLIASDNGGPAGPWHIMYVSETTSDTAVFATTNQGISDVAITPDGRMFALTQRGLMSINPATGVVSQIGVFGSKGANALVADHLGRLFAASDSGEFFEIDPATARARTIGYYGSGRDSSGDLAFAPDGRLFATLRSSPSDLLATININTGLATVIGPIGYMQVHGLAFAADGRLFASVNGGSVNAALVIVNPSTGASVPWTTPTARGLSGLASVTQVPTTPVPGAPVLSVADPAASTLSLSWIPGPGPAPSQYTLQAGTSPGASNLGVVSMGLATSFSAAAPAGLRLYLRVVASNQYGSAVSNEITTLAGAVAAPAAPVLTGQFLANPITLSWTAGAGGGTPQSYVLVAGTTAGAADLGTAAMGSSTSIMAVVPRGLTIYARVVAQNASGAATSNEITFTVPAAQPPTPPLLQPAVVTGSTVSLAWSGASGATYVLRARATPTGPVLVSSDVGGATAVTVPNVGSGTYYVSAVAVVGGQPSGESNQVTVVVP